MQALKCKRNIFFEQKLNFSYINSRPLLLQPKLAQYL